MHKHTFKIAFFGNGKFTKAIIFGLLRSKAYTPADIVVIVREDSLSDKKFFEKNRIHVSTNPQDAAYAEHVILSVTPKGAGSVLNRLAQVVFEPREEREIISFVSGLSSKQILRVFPNKDTQPVVICATGNTNVAFGKGIVCMTRDSKIFQSLGLRSFEPEDQILNSVVSTGSLNGLVSKALIIAHRAQSETLSFEDWASGLYHLYVSKKMDTSSVVPLQYKVIFEHLELLAVVMSEQPLFYRYDIACDKIRFTIKSILETVFTAKDHYPGCVVSELCFTNIITSVVTPGGCTEKGIDALSSIEVLLNKTKLADTIITPIVVAAHTFPTQVIASLQAPIQESVPMH